MEIGNHIKELRKQKGLRQEQLAEAMGVSTASVSKWETNQSYPELTVLAELADFFEVSIDTLIGHTLNADRLEAMIAQMEMAADDHEEDVAASLSGTIIRNYPNDSRAVEACADCWYKLHIHTGEKIYMERCIAQTKRLMSLKRGEPEKDRLERIHSMGNQYGHLEQWDAAKECYEQSNVGGRSSASIAECLLKQGNAGEAIEMISGVLVEGVFQGFHAINILADGWVERKEYDKACSALKWMYGVMDSLHYNPTTMLLILIKLAGLYDELAQPELAKAAFRQAAELVKKNGKQEVHAEADFLLIKEAREMLTSAPEGNQALLTSIAARMGDEYIGIVNEVLL